MIPCCSVNHMGSLEIDHSSPLYQSNNETLYAILEEETRNSIYSLIITPYSRVECKNFLTCRNRQVGEASKRLY